MTVADSQFVFVGGLHKSGTSLLARCLAEHPSISAFRDTGVPEDEGQHLQTVYPPARAYGGAGKFGFDDRAHMTENSPLVSEESRNRLLAEWSPYWDFTKPVLLEKSPPNLIRTRFLQALFPNSKFLVITRDPVVVGYATQKWSHTGIDSLIEHWLVCHEIFEQDRRYIRRLHVVRYEDLVEDPRAILQELFSFLGLENAPNNVHVRSGVNAAYRRRWGLQSRAAHDEEPLLEDIRHRYKTRVAAFGYHLR